VRAHGWRGRLAERVQDTDGIRLVHQTWQL
jgi:hypothetical protein